jgi:CheY-like chemotaxis protein
VTRILLLEDDRELAAYWKSALEERGYYVAHESNVDSAILALKFAKPFDLVITDILIRDADDRVGTKGGFTLLTHVSLNMREKPKMIAISGANASLNVLRHAELLRADRTLTKPITAEEMVAAAGELVGEPRNDS